MAIFGENRHFGDFPSQSASALWLICDKVAGHFLNFLKNGVKIYFGPTGQKV